MESSELRDAFTVFGFFFPFPLRPGLETPRLALRARPRMVKESGAKMCMKLPEKLDFAGRFLQLVFVAELCIPPLSPLKEFTCRFSHAAVTEISKFLDISNNSLV